MLVSAELLLHANMDASVTRTPCPLNTQQVSRMSLMFLFGLIGLFIGGLRGLVVGAALGFVVGIAMRKVVVKNLASVQEQFFESTFTVMGALSKADGVVSRDEISTAESIFARLNFSDDQRRLAMVAFSRDLYINHHASKAATADPRPAQASDAREVGRLHAEVYAIVSLR
jgi:hypothetical protein